MISIVIPNYNGLSHLKTCFDSLKNQNFKNFSVILVDNNSNDDSICFTKNNYPDVKIISLNDNYGFSKAVNVGIEYSLKEKENMYVLLLNNDVECKKDFLNQMLDGFIHKDIGSVACKMLNFYNHKIIDNTGLFMDLKDLPLLRGYQETDTGQYDEKEYVFGACAGAGIYHRKVFKTIGIFDEDFFAYHEDMDFNLRLQLSGFKCFYNPEAVCYHKGSSTSGNKSDFKIYLCEKNIILLRLKNYPAKILFQYSIFNFYFGIKRFLRYFIDGSFSNFWSAVKGFTNGMLSSMKILKKRKELMKLQKISFGKIEFMP